MASGHLHKLLTGSRYVGIEHFSREGKVHLVSGIVIKKREGVVIEEPHFSDSDITSSITDKQLPFVLVINTSQVIQKEVASVDLSDDKLLQKTFPSLDRGEFYYEIWRHTANSIIAVARKDYVEGVISDYLKLGISIAKVSLGITAASSIEVYLKGEEWLTNSHTISLESERTFSLLPIASDDVYTINGLEITNRTLLLFSSVLGEIVGSKSTTGNILIRNGQLKDGFLQNRFFSKGLKMGLGLLLLILLVNFFAFTHYFKKSEEISEAIQVNKSSMENIAQAKARIKIKEERLELVSDISASRATVILNDITKAVPGGIVLDELDLNPLQEKIKEGEGIKFQEHTINIQGSTIHGSEFSAWLEKLERMSFTDKIIITKYGKNDKGRDVFSIKLILKS